jgi:hypothetical protein
MRRPWEAIRAAMQEELSDLSWTELFFGTAFLAFGSRPWVHELRSVPHSHDERPGQQRTAIGPKGNEKRRLVWHVDLSP